MQIQFAKDANTIYQICKYRLPNVKIQFAKYLTGSLTLVSSSSNSILFLLSSSAIPTLVVHSSEYTIEKYSLEIHLTNIVEKYILEIPLTNTVEKYN